jgi:hypothetical protein
MNDADGSVHGLFKVLTIIWTERVRDASKHLDLVNHAHRDYGTNCTASFKLSPQDQCVAFEVTAGT